MTEENKSAPAGRILLARPFPQAEIEAGRVVADGLISITGVADGPATIDETLFAGNVLRLSFDDIPGGTWSDARGNSWRGPEQAQLRAAIAFAKEVRDQAQGDQVLIAVHCLHGKSRSAAVALAIMAEQLEAGQEDEAVRRLLVYDTMEQVSCNPGIVRMADAMLGRAGAIERALAAACPRFVTWRAYWVRHGCIDEIVV